MVKMTDQRSSSSCQPRNKTFSRIVLPISPHEWMLRISGYRYSLPSCLSYSCYVSQTNTRIILTSMCILRRKIENTVTSAAKDCLLSYSVSLLKFQVIVRHTSFHSKYSCRDNYYLLIAVSETCSSDWKCMKYDHAVLGSDPNHSRISTNYTLTPKRIWKYKPFRSLKK